MFYARTRKITSLRDVLSYRTIYSGCYQFHTVSSLASRYRTIFTVQFISIHGVYFTSLNVYSVSYKVHERVSNIHTKINIVIQSVNSFRVGQL